MKVLPITPSRYNSATYYAKNSAGINRYNSAELSAAYYPVCFKAKTINIPSEKSKLIRQFNQILKRDTIQPSDEEFVAKIINSIHRFIEQKAKKIEQIESQTNVIKSNRVLTPIQKQEALNKLRKEYIRVQKSMPQREYSIKDEDNSTDFLLINKFKSAILDDNYNLKKVFLSHYEPLNSINTIEEINEQFPFIPTPIRPENVAAEKIVKNLPKEFFMTLNEHYFNEDSKGAAEFLKERCLNMLKDAFGKHLDTFNDETAIRIVKALGDAIIARYDAISDKNTFDSLPQIKKLKAPLISDNDIALLKIDFDDYVLSVIRDIYLNFKKPNEIIYSKDNQKISVGKIKDNPYRFEKLDETIKHFISDAENIKNAQRQYERHSNDELRNRILFYTDRIGYNERLLEKMVEFDSCMFTEEDREQLHKFLRKLDSVFDEEKSIEQILNEIFLENIHPQGTAKINELERKMAVSRLKEEQKSAAKLRALQSEFDDAINILYKNNLNYTAETASVLRPESLDNIPEGFEFVVKTVKKYTDRNSNLTDKTAVQKQILYWNKYNEHKNKPSELLSRAEAYAKDKHGNIDQIKAGKYLFNYDVVSAYPETGGYNKEILAFIMDSFGHDTGKAVKYLCNYDDYQLLTSQNGQKIKNILKTFNPQNPEDKIIIKRIIENEYIKSDTEATATLPGNQSVKTIITANAKQELYDYYMFPKCLEFYEAFENAMTVFAVNKASAGIKKLGKNNNSLSNVMEIKILGYDDRLICYDGSYRFNKFTPIGIH